MAFNKNMWTYSLLAGCIYIVWLCSGASILTSLHLTAEHCLRPWVRASLCFTAMGQPSLNITACTRSRSSLEIHGTMALGTWDACLGAWISCMFVYCPSSWQCRRPTQKSCGPLSQDMSSYIFRYIEERSWESLHPREQKKKKQET